MSIEGRIECIKMCKWSSFTPCNSSDITQLHTRHEHNAWPGKEENNNNDQE